MQVEAKFYERLHSDTGYGRSRFDVPRLMRQPAYQRWAAKHRSRAVRVLDIGCGKGQFLLDVTSALAKDGFPLCQRVAVVDLIRTRDNVLDQIKPVPEFNQQSVDDQPLPFGDDAFDFISCNHVLEHIFETEKLLREIHRVATPDALVVISVPNVAAWMNRLAFLMGGQPLGSEVGTESVEYGFWPGFLQSRLKAFHPSGHIRDFTPRSLRDLSRRCGFQPVGWWAQNGGLVATWGRNLGILLEPRPTP